MKELKSLASDFARVPSERGEGLIKFSGAEAVPLITRYIRVGLRRKWIIIGTAVTCLFLGLIVTLMMTPLFTATSTIEISREASKIVNVRGVEPEGGGAADLEFYQTQYGLLRARTLAERVARDLKLADNAAFFDSFGASPSAGLFSGDAPKAISAEERDDRVRKAGEILLQNVSISPVRGSRLVAVNFTGPDAALAATVANSWSRNFIESNLERRFEASSYARRFLEDRLAQIRRRLDESERLLVAYASNQKIINIPTSTAAGEPSGERSIVADDLAAINSELAKATADRIRAESRTQQAGRAGAGASTEALANDAISALRQQRAEVAAEYSKMMEQFEPGYPTARALHAQLEQLDRSIAREETRVRESLDTSYRESTAREQALAARVEGLKSSFLDQRRRSIQYNILQREVDTNRQLYDGLLQRYKEIGVTGGVGTNNISVVDPAQVPRAPSRPKPLRNMLLALLLGLVLGVALAFAREQMDEAISDPSQVEKDFNLPVLGTIPKSEEEPKEALRNPKSPMVEAYLAVQTNLEFSTEHGVPRTIAVTSTRPAEGKSTTAYALAHALAKARKKVVLVDGDMRSPSVHGLFGFKNDAGLSNFLSGNSDLAQLIHPTPQLGLNVIAAGPPPPNAAELLTGERFGLLLAGLLESFDHIVIDSPPVMGLADAPLIASHVEATVFAVEAHGSRSSMVRMALGRLNSANARIIGAVLTKFETKRAHFGYGYDYGYGYGEDHKYA